MNLEQKLKIIEACGVDIVYVINFTEDYSKITANDFMNHTIIPFFNPKIIIIGPIIILEEEEKVHHHI